MKLKYFLEKGNNDGSDISHSNIEKSAEYKPELGL